MRRPITVVRPPQWTWRHSREELSGKPGAVQYGFAGGDPVNFSDPFGLCPPCTGTHDAVMLPIISEAIGGGEPDEPALIPATPPWELVWGVRGWFKSAWAGARGLVGAAVRGGFVSRSMGKGSVKIGKSSYQVHVERGGSGQLQIHVQTTGGPGKGTKVTITDPTDLSALDKSVRTNTEIQNRLKKAFEELEKMRDP